MLTIRHFRLFSFLILLLCCFEEGRAQQFYIDIIDTNGSVHYKVAEQESYYVKLLTDTAPVKRKVTSIYKDGMILCTGEKAATRCDSASFQLIDSLGWQTKNAFWKTYGVFAAIGAAGVIGSYLTLSDLSSDSKEIITILSIPLGLVILPFTGAYFLTDKVYPIEYLNTTDRYKWYLKKVPVKVKEPEKKDAPVIPPAN